MNTPFLIILDGPMGAGKTTAAALLFKKLKRTAVLSWDTTKWFVTDYGAEDADWTTLLDVQKAMVATYMAHRFSVVIDGGFARADRLKLFLALAKKHGYCTFVFQFVASYHTLLARASARPKPVAERKKISKQGILKNLSFYEEHKYQGSDVTTIDSEKMSPQQIVKLILKKVVV